MILLSLHCRNSEALRCSVLQTGSVVYGSLSITSFESVINQSELCVQILDACLTHARKHHRDPCRLSFTQRACSQARLHEQFEPGLSLVRAIFIAGIDLLDGGMPPLALARGGGCYFS